MVSLLLTPSATSQDLINTTQALVNTDPLFSGWNVSSNLPKDGLTLRNQLDPRASCTAKVRGLHVEIAASPAGSCILMPLVSFLHEVGLTNSGNEHLKAQVDASTDGQASVFESNLAAVQAAAAAFPGLLVIHDNALKVAASSGFEDPKFTYAALMALADVALREQKLGLKSTRQARLAEKGFSYVSGSSDCTLNKHRKDYTLLHEGKAVVIAGHISKGVKARRLLRIYFAWLPESKSYLIGHVGAHLPTETNSH